MTDSSPEPTKRKKGGQPGNINALKHGLYIEGRSVRNTTPIERAQLFDLNDIITLAKQFTVETYLNALKSKTHEEFNTSARSLGIHNTGLSRLMTIHNQFQNSSLPSDFIVTKKTTVMHLADHYKKKLSTIIDISELTDLNHDSEASPPITNIEDALDSQTPLPHAGRVPKRPLRAGEGPAPTRDPIGLRKVQG